MPLSEHEQKMLEQLEHALANEDPRFASHMRGNPASPLRRRRLIIGGIGVLVGLVLVIVGIQTTMWVGAGGFALMVAAVAYALSPVAAKPEIHAIGVNGQPLPRTKGRKQRGGSSGNKQRGGSSGTGGSFMQRLDERWERRRRDR